MKNYVVKLMNGDEVYITEEEFMRMKGREGAVYIPSINEIINLNRIERVYKVKDMKQTNIFLPKPKKESDFEKIGITKGMEKLFNTLKERGLFKGFNSYQNWCGAKEILKDKMAIKK